MVTVGSAYIQQTGIWNLYLEHEHSEGSQYTHTHIHTPPLTTLYTYILIIRTLFIVHHELQMLAAQSNEQTKQINSNMQHST